MFLLDKYNVNNLNDVIFHRDIYAKLIIGYDMNNKLYNLEEFNRIINLGEYHKIDHFMKSKNKNYKKYKSMPNLFIHGSNGCGKHTLIKQLLNDIYDDTVNNIFIETYSINGYGNTSVDVNIEQSKYHIIIEPNNSGLDKYIIQEIVKEYAQKQLINDKSSNYPFRTVVINNIDNLHYYAQTSLRCTMEKYYKTCRFILCGYQSSKLINPIKSRCLDIIIPLPKYDELFEYLVHILINEKKSISKKKIDKIIVESEGNIKKMLWLLDMSLLKIIDWNLSWKTSLNKLLYFMNQFKNQKITILNERLIIETRAILYNVYTTNIPGTDILYELINKIIYSNSFDTIIVNNILQVASEIDTRLNRGKRSIIHLDAFMCKVYKLLYEHYQKCNTMTNITVS